MLHIIAMNKGKTACAVPLLYYSFIAPLRLNESFAFAGEKHDVTDELVKAFNKAHKK